MKNVNFNRIFLFLINLFFVIFIIVALGANLFGLDIGLTWGGFRIALLATGTGGLFLTLLFFVSAKIEKRMPQRRETSGGEPGKKSSTSQAGSRTRSILLSFGMILAVLLLYVGFISVWNWVDWPKSTHYYGMLGEALLQGKTSLPIEPSPLLANLKNPYSSAERGSIPVVTDLSYFNGKYYMYWGPAPAGVAALLTLLTGKVPGDEMIIFLSISAAFIFLFLIVRNLKDRFFPSIPGWLNKIVMIAIATSFPFLWVLNSPDIYGAAIAAGQAFLLGGLLFALPALSVDPTPHWRLILAGTFWVMAIGSRLVLAFPIAVILLGIFIRWILRARISKKWFAGISTLFSIGVPMLVGLILLGLYNYVRFGDFLETGLRYSLNPHDLSVNAQDGLIFNLRYFIPNLLYYFVTPIRTVARFPFLKPFWGPVDRFQHLAERLDVSGFYTIDNIVGLFFVVPTLLFVIFLISALIDKKSLNAQRGNSIPAQYGDPGLSFDARFTLGFILLAGITASLPILTYFYVSIRYMLDFMPLLNIAIVVAMWQLFRTYDRYPIRRWIVIILIVSSVIVAAMIGFVLALTGAQTRFDDFNPALFNALTEFFR